MTYIACQLIFVTTFIMLLNITPSWGQLNPTGSDANRNTAGGANAFGTCLGFAGVGACIGSDNVAFGAFALRANTTGSSNTATGTLALRDNTGNENTAIGAAALLDKRSGNNNTATGAFALSANETGDANVANGFHALESNFVGNFNTAVGAKTLKKSRGTKNIGIGFQAGVPLVNGNNNIYIGNQGAGDEFQTIRIGTAQSQTFIAGIKTASVGDAQVMVDTTTGQLGIVTSSARYKEDIETMANRSDGLLKLRPVTFVYKDDGSAAPHYGLIAEEVATVYPELVTRTASGDVQTVKYHELIPMLLNELQREHQEVASLRRELVELRALVGSRVSQ